MTPQIQRAPASRVPLLEAAIAERNRAQDACIEGSELLARHQRELFSLRQRLRQLGERQTSSRWLDVCVKSGAFALVAFAGFAAGTEFAHRDAVAAHAEETAILRENITQLQRDLLQSKLALDRFRRDELERIIP